MNDNTIISRRQFIRNAAVASAALVAAPSFVVAAGAEDRWPIIGFSKPFQNLSYDDTADVTAEIGWNGIECPVRPKGQIEPERAEEELPKLVEALKKRGLTIEIMTTRIDDASDATTQKLLATAAKLGIKRYRMNYWKYHRKSSVADQLAEIRPKLRDLAALNKEVGIQGAYQNHSGDKYVGAPIWDLFGLLKGIDPKNLGICFDIGHATVEGGYAWPTHVHLAQPKFAAIYLKDFKWEKTPKGWKAAWCPVGEGMVNKDFFTTLKKSKYQGPISQHHEYDHGEGKPMIAKMQKDLKVLKHWLAEA